MRNRIWIGPILPSAIVDFDYAEPKSGAGCVRNLSSFGIVAANQAMTKISIPGISKADCLKFYRFDILPSNEFERI